MGVKSGEREQRAGDRVAIICRTKGNTKGNGETKVSALYKPFCSCLGLTSNDRRSNGGLAEVTKGLAATR